VAKLIRTAGTHSKRFSARFLLIFLFRAGILVRMSIAGAGPRKDATKANRFLRQERSWVAVAVAVVLARQLSVCADSDPSHICRDSELPVAWPEGIVPYDISKLTGDQQATVKQAMQRWMDTGARLAFVPRASQRAFVNFTGRTDAGNNTSLTGFKPNVRADINITAFWWRQGEWMPAHEFGHVLGFHHEHARWDRDTYLAVHYEHIKVGRGGDYDWIPRTNWLVTTTPYDYHSIMHYRVCWASSCESQCHDGDGASPCAVLAPLAKEYGPVIGQWSDNKISVLDAEKARSVYGVAMTIYISDTGTSSGDGTLDNPYRSLAEARSKAPKAARLIDLNNSKNN
jgi:hypothetical protein